jgi:hypothetical protein
MGDIITGVLGIAFALLLMLLICVGVYILLHCAFGLSELLSCGLLLCSAVLLVAAELHRH